MLAALSLSRRNLGETWPNPSVGCVVVNGGRVVARAVTASGGRPHAEALAIERAGAGMRGATVFVTLEPCAHRGETPSCADLLIEAGVHRVVVSAQDPDPRTGGKGIARLEKAGIEVTTGVEESAGRQVHAGHFSRVSAGRPYVTLKIATTLDGKVAVASGESRWITGRRAREFSHGLRASHDAVLVGHGTAAVDSPSLDCRLPGMASRSPVRIVVDSNLGMQPERHPSATRPAAPAWVVCGRSAVTPQRRAAFESRGIKVIPVQRTADNRVALDDMLQQLGSLGLTRLLVEGGPTIAGSFMDAGLVDRLVWFHAPTVIGDDGLAALPPVGVASIDDLRRFRVVWHDRIGADGLLVMDAQSSGCGG